MVYSDFYIDDLYTTYKMYTIHKVSIYNTLVANIFLFLFSIFFKSEYNKEEHFFSTNATDRSIFIAHIIHLMVWKTFVLINFIISNLYVT